MDDQGQVDDVSHGDQWQRIEHAVANDLVCRLRYEVVPIIGAVEGGDLLCESLVRQFGGLRNEQSGRRRNRSFGLRQNMRIFSAR